jgi:hypothetical protein
MTRFRTILVLSLLTAGCGGNADTATLKTASIDVPEDAGVGLGGAENVPFGGSGGSGSAPDAGQGGAGGSEVTGTGGTDPGDAGGALQGGAGGASDQGGAGGSDVNQGGSDQGGTGGTDVGGSGGSEQGGTGGTDVGQGGSDQGGAGGTDGQPPACDYQGGTCDGLNYSECDGGEYFEYPCDFNCEDNRGCFGHCTTGDVRCSGDTAEACVDGEWTTTEECAFQCVAGACEGACTPGAVVCDGLSTVTCGSDFHFGGPVACPTDPNGTTSCSNGVCDLQPIACGAGAADCDGNWSCESNLSSIATCGSCDTACESNPANAAPTCSESTGCGFTCDAGFEDCDGNPANGCELDTRADALNCGACGNSCYGTSCSAGQCEFSFEVVSDDSDESASVPVRVQKQVQDLAVSDTYVYWLTRAELRRAPKTGGASETLATLTAHPSTNRYKTLVVDAGKVAWTTVDGVYVMPEAGGSPTRILTTVSSTAVGGLLSANGKLYWNDSPIDGVNTGSCANSPSVTNEATFLTCSGSHQTTFHTYDLTLGTFSSWQISAEMSPPLAVISNTMYVAYYGPIWPGTAQYAIRLNTYNAATGAAGAQIGGTFNVNGNFTAAHNMFFGAAVAADKLVYSADFQGGAATGFATAPLAGGTNTLIIAGTSSREFVADATAVYYRGGDNFTSVQAVSLTGQALDPIFQGETNDALQLAQDDTHIYFTAYTNDGEQAVLRAPK